MSFVLRMRDKAQGTVIALVNKQITGERNLSESVLPPMKSQQWGSPPGSGSGLQKCWSWTLWAPVTRRARCCRSGFSASWAKSMTNWPRSLRDEVSAPMAVHRLLGRLQPGRGLGRARGEAGRGPL